MVRLTVAAEVWPIRGVFRISRGARTESRVVVVTLEADGVRGRGECLPYARYDERVEGVMEQVQRLEDDLRPGLDRDALQDRLPPGAARNAVDCAMWDLDAKRSGTPVWRLADLPEPVPLTSAFTVSLAEPEEMADAAGRNADRPLLKLKITGDRDVERVRAVHQAAPHARLIVDANEAWSPETFADVAPAIAELGVEMIEQPFPAGRDETLIDLEHPVPVCADEACHTSDDVEALADRYDAVNIKLDKTGGLTEALRLARAAQAAGLDVMVGCMVGTSLGIAPAALLGWAARWVDLDAPLWMARDREPAMRFEGSVVYPPPRELWG